MRPEHETLGYWLVRTQEVAEPDQPVLAMPEVSALNRDNETVQRLGFGGRIDLLAPVDLPALAQGLDARLGFLRGRFTTGRYMQLDGNPVPTALQGRYAGPVTAEALAVGFLAPTKQGNGGLQPEIRVALALVPIHCGPQTEPYFNELRDPAFDRNLCSVARAQELVQVLRPWDAGLALARTSYVTGWIDLTRAALSPPLHPEQVRRFHQGPHRRSDDSQTLVLATGETITLPFASLVPTAPQAGDRVLVATATGVAEAEAAGLLPPSGPLTRRAVLTQAFAFLGYPYGWGGRAGGRDCSRFLMDLFAGLGLRLPRHTSDQALAGSYIVEVPADATESERLALLDRYHRRGILLLHFPGHIMLYLGRDDAGTPMVIHSFAEYLLPCPGRPADAAVGDRETLLKVDGVRVSDLELGRGSSRTAFIQRITKIAVLGPKP